MSYLVYIFVPLSIGLLTPLFYRLIEKYNIRKEMNMQTDYYNISSSFILCLILVTTETIYSIILIIMNIFDNIDLIQNVICISILVFFAIGCYALIKEKIEVENENIKYTPAFGKTKVYCFNDIKHVEEMITSRGLITYQIYSDKKIFSISSINVGTKLFINKIKRLGILVKTFSK